ncbi:hypothetical protein ACVMFA_004643 [Bradyrhizobium liaoningense]
MHEAKLHGIGHTHEYDRNGGGCRLQRYGRLRTGGDKQLGTEGNQIGDRRRQSIRGMRKAILDDEIFSFDPAEASQRVKKHKLGLIEGFPASITYSEKAESTAFSLRARIAWRNEQRRGARYELPPFHSTLIAA